ncbi:MAG: DUF4238 domain-containing protein [Sedimentisphaerales bacterium]|nr:DUF4238 domain-containing protein [Sedimentisphaerales bacterium]
MTQTTENQHFVPQFYLRGFSIPKERSLVWEFDKERGRYAKAPRSIRTICSRRRYYRQMREGGVEEPDMLEKGFSRELEQKVSPLYRTLLARIAEGTSEITLTPMEYGQFCYFVAMQYTRVPSFRDKMAFFMKMHSEQMLRHKAEVDRRSGRLPPRVDELLRHGGIKITVEDWGTVKVMIEAATTVTNALLDKTPGFFRVSPGDCFVTSDNPVSYYVKDYQKHDIARLEPVHPDAEVLFPLNRDCAVVFFPYKSGYGATQNEIRCRCLDLLPPLAQCWNMQTAIAAERFIFTGIWLNYLHDAASESPPEARGASEGDPEGQR